MSPTPFFGRLDKEDQSTQPPP